MKRKIVSVGLPVLFSILYYEILMIVVPNQYSSVEAKLFSISIPVATAYIVLITKNKREYSVVGGCYGALMLILFMTLNLLKEIYVGHYLARYLNRDLLWVVLILVVVLVAGLLFKTIQVILYRRR